MDFPVDVSVGAGGTTFDTPEHATDSAIKGPKIPGIDKPNSSAHLLHKRRIRHMDAIASFQNKVRELGIVTDRAHMSALSSHKVNQKMSHEDRQRLVDQLEANLKEMKETVSFYTSPQPGVETSDLLITDDIHPQGAAVEQRGDRIQERKNKLLRLLERLRDQHRQRMVEFGQLVEAMKVTEAKRKQEIQRLLGKLLEQLTSIAWCDTTQSQLVVQRAAASVNEQLVDNQIAIEKLSSGLRQHDVLFHRSLLQRVSKIWDDVLDATADSVVLWTKQYLSSSVMHSPQCRVGVLAKVGDTYHHLSKEVSTFIGGLDRATGSLGAKADPKDAEEVDIPGGTALAGWLATFQQGVKNDCFSSTPMKVAKQWRVSVELLIHQMKCASDKLVTEARTVEQELQEEAARIIIIMLQDIETTYTLTEVQNQTVESCCYPEGMAVPEEDVVAAQEEVRGDGGNSVPPPEPSASPSVAPTSSQGVTPIPKETPPPTLPQRTVRPSTVVQIVTNVPRMLTVQREARKQVEVLRGEIEGEGNTFVELLQTNMASQATCLHRIMLANRQSIISMFTGATLSMEEAVRMIATHIRRFIVQDEECDLDFKDSWKLLEDEYKNTCTKLLQSGSQEEAEDMYNKAYQVLVQIETLYCTTHENRVDPLIPFIQATKETIQRFSSMLFQRMSMITLAEAEAHNERVVREAEAAAVVEKKGKSKDKGTPTPEPKLEKIHIEDCERYTSGSGVVYVLVSNSLLFGEYDPVVQEVRDSTTPPLVAETQKPDPVREGTTSRQGKREKDLGGTISTIQDDTNDAADAGQADPAAMSAAARLAAMVTPHFPDDLLISVEHKVMLEQKLREKITQWAESYGECCIERVQAFATKTKTKLDAWTNEAMRQHYRRAPTLQATIFEHRIRELDEGKQGRLKFFKWMENRSSSVVSHTDEYFASVEKQLEANYQQLVDSRNALPSIMSISALESHSRAFADMKHNVANAVGDKLDPVLNTFHNHIMSIRKECATYKEEKMKPFSQGGRMGDNEVTEAEKSMDELNKRLSDVVDGMVKRVEEAKAKQIARIEKEAAQYTEDNATNAAELKLFQSVQEILAAAKGRVSNIIAVSNSSERELETIITELEGMLVKPTPKKDTASVVEVLRNTLQGQGQNIPVDDKWIEDDAALSNLARKTRVNHEEALLKSRPMELLHILDTMRKQLYSRGLFLGCLHYGADFQFLPEESFVDPKKAEEPPAQNARSQTPSSPQGKNAKGKAQAKKAEEARPVVIDEHAGWNKFLKMVKGEVQVHKAIAPCREQVEAVVAAFFQAKPPQLIHTQVLGPDVNAVKETIAHRLQVQDERSRTHVADGVKRYRELVQRAFLIIPRLAPELYNGLYNSTVDCIKDRTADDMAVFRRYFSSITNAKRQYSSLVKGSMAAPANRPQLNKLMEQELYRQQRAIQMVKKYTGIVLRDHQDEATRFASRCCQVLSTLFTMVKTVVTPEHLVPGEDIIVGHHKGLKRLLRQKQREDQAKALEQQQLQAGKDAKGKDKKGADAKKPPKDDKKAKGKGAANEPKEDEDVQVLPHLERLTQEFPGVQINKARRFAMWTRDTGSAIQLRNHLQTPAQWALADAAAAAASEDAAAMAAAAASSKKPPPKAAPKKGAPQQTEEAADPTQEAPVLSTTLTAPKDRVHQAAALLRQQTVEHFMQLYDRLAEEASTVFKELEVIENEWVESWTSVTATLQTEQVKQKRKEQLQQQDSALAGSAVESGGAPSK